MNESPKWKDSTENAFPTLHPHQNAEYKERVKNDEEETEEGEKGEEEEEEEENSAS